MPVVQHTKIEFYLNQQKISIAIPPDETALQLLKRLNAFEVKEACAEGDCGACTVALGQLQQNKITYKAVTSCLLPAARLHKTHVLTAAGLGQPNNLHPIQNAMYNSHATQCGFCTPGIVMSIFCLLANNNQPGIDEFITALEGNLCRCTGYQQIVKAGQSLIDSLHQGLYNNSNIMPDYCPHVWQQLTQLPDAPEYINQQTSSPWPVQAYYMHYSLDSLYKTWQGQQGHAVIAGATDLFVQANVGRHFKQVYHDISQIEDLKGVNVTKQGLDIGAVETLQNIFTYPGLNRLAPALYQSLKQMASLQIRHVGTLGGNIGNASPVADAACALISLNAKLILTGPDGQRQVELADFYLDYKKTILQPSEIIARVLVPTCISNYNGFYKTVKRKAVDISSVSCGVNLVLAADGTITKAVVAYGGVKQFPSLAKLAMGKLVGQPLNKQTAQQAAEAAVSEFEPLSDVRGSSQYRQLLIKNLLLQHLDTLPEAKHD